MVRTSRALDTDWTVRAAGGPAPDPIRDAVVAAVVPGVVHLDLMRAGLVPDPYLDDNEALLAWVGLVDWTYECPLVLTEHDLAAAQRHELVFDGLDTVAAVLLDGEVVAEVANQHRQYRLDVTERLRAGETRLTVAFRSPVRYANAQSAALGARPRPYPLPYEAIR
ncbi:MAG: glycosyl hydrolase 2 galactose-binding domain-containing protein, partial [Ornithinibacter sp.]